ncbi:MAG: glutathione S-transferase [Myxococcales bacterium]|nr:MAG: glutathione S-transferase [Myxococcales bacterium]
MTLRVYRHPISGHCHRVELYLSLLGVPHELIHVDLSSGAHKQADFLVKSPFGQVPVMEDGEVTLADSIAILTYLGERYDEARRYWPRDALERAKVQRWLSVAAGQLAYGPAAARRAKLLGDKLDYDATVRISQRLFGVMERELTEAAFLVGSQPTLADLALYAYTARAPEGDVSLEPYPAIRAWLGRVEALPGFVPMLVSRS